MISNLCKLETLFNIGKMVFAKLIFFPPFFFAQKDFQNNKKRFCEKKINLAKKVPRSFNILNFTMNLRKLLNFDFNLRIFLLNLFRYFWFSLFFRVIFGVLYYSRKRWLPSMSGSSRLFMDEEYKKVWAFVYIYP
jgi:hypothetical protein